MNLPNLRPLAEEATAIFQGLRKAHGGFSFTTASAKGLVLRNTVQQVVHDGWAILEEGKHFVPNFNLAREGMTAVTKLASEASAVLTAEEVAAAKQFISTVADAGALSNNVSVRKLGHTLQGKLLTEELPNVGETLLKSLTRHSTRQTRQVAGMHDGMVQLLHELGEKRQLGALADGLKHKGGLSQELRKLIAGDGLNPDELNHLHHHFSDVIDAIYLNGQALSPTGIKTLESTAGLSNAYRDLSPSNAVSELATRGGPVTGDTQIISADTLSRPLIRPGELPMAEIEAAAAKNAGSPSSSPVARQIIAAKTAVENLSTHTIAAFEGHPRETQNYILKLFGVEGGTDPVDTLKKLIGNPHENKDVLKALANATEEIYQRQREAFATFSKTPVGTRQTLSKALQEAMAAVAKATMTAR